MPFSQFTAPLAQYATQASHACLAQNDVANDFIKTAQQQIENDLTLFLQSIALPDNLKNAVSYACLAGGKRVRPALVYASYFTTLTTALTASTVTSTKCTTNGIKTEPTSQKPQNSEIKPSLQARRAALAVELLHCYSLVHDDLPCMDDDELRRGKPTCHVVYGEAVALLAGDVLQTLAFEALTAFQPSDLADINQQNRQSDLLATFAPRARRMVAGQMRDLNAENRVISLAELEKIHRDKTGALIEAAVLMGAICASPDHSLSDNSFSDNSLRNKQLSHLHVFAQKLGLAFQVQDDILDITSTTTALGKPAGSDEKLAKSTYPKLMGLDNAKQYANRLFTEANQALPDTANLLRLLADWLWARKH